MHIVDPQHRMQAYNHHVVTACICMYMNVHVKTIFASITRYIREALDSNGFTNNKLLCRDLRYIFATGCR